MRWLKSKIPRPVWFWGQRLQRGFDDSITWSLDATVSEFLLPRLRRFKEINIAYPAGMTAEEWDQALDKMIAAFEFGASEERWLDIGPGYAKHQEGLDLFAKHFWSLWW